MSMIIINLFCVSRIHTSSWNINQCILNVLQRRENNFELALFMNYKITQMNFLTQIKLCVVKHRKCVQCGGGISDLRASLLW